MHVSYNKLWKMLIDKKLNKTKLRDMVGIGTTTLARMTKDEKVSMEVLIKICMALDCTVDDVLDFYPDEDISR